MGRERREPCSLRSRSVESYERSFRPKHCGETQSCRRLQRCWVCLFLYLINSMVKYSFTIHIACRFQTPLKPTSTLSQRLKNLMSHILLLCGTVPCWMWNLMVSSFLIPLSVPTKASIDFLYRFNRQKTSNSTRRSGNIPSLRQDI